jgi:hypothetical protein
MAIVCYGNALDTGDRCSPARMRYSAVRCIPWSSCTSGNLLTLPRLRSQLPPYPLLPPSSCVTVLIHRGCCFATTWQVRVRTTPLHVSSQNTINQSTSQWSTSGEQGHHIVIVVTTCRRLQAGQVGTGMCRQQRVLILALAVCRPVHILLTLHGCYSNSGLVRLSNIALLRTLMNHNNVGIRLGNPFCFGAVGGPCACQCTPAWHRQPCFDSSRPAIHGKTLRLHLLDYTPLQA